MPRRAMSCLVALLLLSLCPSAPARTRRHCLPVPVKVALQPFLVARSVVHAIAEPVVVHTTRAVARVATAPIRVAYRSVRDRNDEAPRGDSVEDEPAAARAI